MNKLIAIASAVLLLSGCASGVSRNANKSVDAVSISAVSGQAQSKVTKDNPLTNITINLSDDAAKKVADNLKFNQSTLLDHVKRALESNKYYVANAAKQGMSMDIVVTDFRVRSNFASIAFGFLAGSDSITGDIIIKNPSGQEVDRFEVSASYALGGLAGGMDDSRMNWLYEAFATETLKEIQQGK